MTAKFFVLGLLFFLVQKSWAQESKEITSKEEMLSGLGFFAAQDAFFPPKNEDREYTFGGGVALGGAWVGHKYNPFAYPLKWLHHYPSKWFLGANSQDRHVFYTGLKAYTPDLIQADTIVRSDRPYSNILFVAFRKMSLSSNEKRMLSTDFRLGILGTHAAREIQTWFHQKERELKGRDEPYDPKGWQHQISNDGELTGLWKIQLAFDPSKDLNPNQIQVVPRTEISLGYKTYVQADLTMRIGRLNSPWYSFQTDPMENGFLFQPKGEKWFEAYLIAKGVIRYVFYDALLQGQFKQTAYRLPESDLKQLQGGFRFGAGFRTDVFESWATINIHSATHWKNPNDHYWMNLVGLFYF